MKHLVLPVSAALLLGAALAAQEPLTSRLPRDWSSAIRWFDVLPHAERALASERFAATWREAVPHLRAFEPSLGGLSPAALSGSIALFRDFVPVEIVAAWPESTSAGVGALLEAAVRMGLGILVRERGGVEVEGLGAFREDVAGLLASVDSPRLVAAMRMRDARAAERAFQSIADAIEGAQVGDDRLEFSMTLGAAFELARPPVRDALLPPDDDGATAIRDAMRAIRLDLHIALDGDVVELRVGPPVEGPMRDPSAPLWGDAQVDGELLSDGVWSADAFVEHAMAAWELVLGLDDAGFDALFEVGPSEMSAFLDELEGMTETWPDGGYDIRVLADGIEFAEREPLYEFEPPPLGETGVLRAVPDGMPLVATSSFWTFDEWVFVLYDDLVVSLGDLAVEAVQRDLFELHEWADDGAVLLGDRLEAVWDLLGGEDSAVFGEGTVIVADARVAPHVAVVGLPDSPAAARGFFELLVAAVAEGLGHDVPDGGWIRDVALDGGPTVWVPRVPGLPDPGDDGVESRCLPHAVVVDDLFVLSTSVALTRGIVAALQRTDRDDVPSDLVGTLRTDGAAIAGFVRSVARRLPGAGGDDGPVAHAVALAAVVCDALGPVTLDERLRGEELHRRVRVTFRD